MPISKDYSQREMIIDRYLSTGKEYDGQTLMRLVNKELRSRGMLEITARSTFALDIQEINSKFFSKYHKDIISRERRGKQFFYYYSEPCFSIYDRELTEDDIEDIHNMIFTMRRFKGMPRFSWLEELEVRFDQAVMKDQPFFVEFDDSYNKDAMKSFGALLNAIENHKVVELDYKTIEGSKESKHTVNPYYLKQCRLRWYLMASYKGKSNIYTFALDRIKSVSIIQNEVYEPTNVDFEHYFDDIVGVSNYENRPVEHIELWVAEREMPYIISNPLHHSQRIVTKYNDGYIISIDAKQNYELEQIIMSYGENMKVLKPSNLKSLITSRINKLNDLYTQDKNDL